MPNRIFAFLKKNSKNILIIISLIILGFSAYANALNNDFIWDDQHFVIHNNYIRHISLLPRILTNHIASGSYSAYMYYRPLQEISYMVDYFFWELDPKGYHLTCILLHIIVASCLFWFAHIMTGNKKIAFFASAFFIIHPIHSETIAYISGRGDPLVGLFMLLSTIFYVKGIRSRKTSFFTIAGITTLLALFAKENALVFPAIIIAYHFFYRKKFRFKNFIPILSSLVFYILFRTFFVASAHTFTSQLKSAIGRIPGFFNALTNYAKLFFIPYPLQFDYGQPRFPLYHWTVLLGIALSAYVIFLALKYRKDKPLIGFSVSWFFITLMPYSNIYLIYSYMSEHSLYTPSMVVFIGIGYLIHAILKHKPYAFAKRFLLTSIFLVFISLTIRQTTFWATPIQFYEHTLTFIPDSFSAHNNLGVSYADVGNFEKAEEHLRIAIKLRSKPPFKPYDALGVIYRKQEDYQTAKEYFKKALSIKPDYIVALNHLGYLYFEMEQYPEAIAILKRSVEINPLNDIGLYQLGLVYHKTGDHLSAKNYFLKAIHANPGNEHAYFHLAVLARQEGDPSQARSFIQKGFKKEKEFRQALEELSQIN